MEVITVAINHRTSTLIQQKLGAFSFLACCLALSLSGVTPALSPCFSSSFELSFTHFTNCSQLTKSPKTPLPFSPPFSISSTKFLTLPFPSFQNDSPCHLPQPPHQASTFFCVLVSFRMGAGRKTRTILVPEKSAIPTTVNSRGTARNLRTSELCGAIFGCKNATVVECFSNLLFGLPGSHYAYVKNIKPGFPLFLFNYSTRMLYGIFEAVSSGGWNINPHAWTDGSVTTQFPAQVKVQILMQCKPLREDQFSTIISENYFQEGFFWFELDQDQTSNLISLFSSFPTTWASLPEPTHKSKTSAEGSHASIVRQQVEKIEFSGANLELWAGEGVGALSGANLELCVGKGVGATPPQKSWISLFRSGNDDEKRERSHEECSEVRSEETSFSALLQESWDVVVSGEMDDAREAAAETNPWVPSEQTMDAFFNSEADDVRESWEELESPREETKEMKDLPAEKEIWDSSSNGKVMTKEDSHDEHMVIQSKVAEMFFDTISKLSTEVEGLKLSQSVQDQKICRLEYELEKSRMEIQLLRHRCKKLESSETSKSTY